MFWLNSSLKLFLIFPVPSSSSSSTLNTSKFKFPNRSQLHSSFHSHHLLPDCRFRKPTNPLFRQTQHSIQPSLATVVQPNLDLLRICRGHWADPRCLEFLANPALPGVINIALVISVFVLIEIQTFSLCFYFSQTDAADISAQWFSFQQLGGDWNLWKSNKASKTVCIHTWIG